MSAEKPEALDIPYVDDLNCRETYAETVSVVPVGAFDLVRIEFCVNRWAQGGPVRADRVVPVSRLVLPRAVVRALRDGLSVVLGDSTGAQVAPATVSAVRMN
jgi:hypothetical protein